MINHQREQGARHQQEFDAEGIVIVVVGRLELDVHEIDRGSRCGQEKHLHHRVVQAHVCGEEIKITGKVHHCEENLRFAGYTGARSGLPYLQQQYYYGEHMREISSEPKNIHPDLIRRRGCSVCYLLLPRCLVFFLRCIATC